MPFFINSNAAHLSTVLNFGLVLLFECLRNILSGKYDIRENPKYAVREMRQVFQDEGKLVRSLSLFLIFSGNLKKS